MHNWVSYQDSQLLCGWYTVGYTLQEELARHAGQIIAIQMRDRVGLFKL